MPAEYVTWGSFWRCFVTFFSRFFSFHFLFFGFFGAQLKKGGGFFFFLLFWFFLQRFCCMYNTTSLLISPCPESKFLGRTLTLLGGCVSLKWTKFVCMYIQVHVVYICMYIGPQMINYQAFARLYLLTTEYTLVRGYTYDSYS